jgi:thermitase
LNVAAKGAGDQLAVYSNYGKATVHVAAPGGERKDKIVSCYMENPAGELFEGMNGTSMATPLVAGLAAQVLALKPGLKPSEVRDLIMRTGREAPTLKDLIRSEKWVDALATLTALKQQPQTGWVGAAQ